MKANRKASEAFMRASGALPFIYGHRGVRSVVPENTMAAFERAFSLGADGIELDVRLCKSGEVVVMHDVDLKRMALREDRIEDLDYPTLRRIDLGGGATAPLLHEVLDMVFARGKRINVEIKSDVPDLRVLAHATAVELLTRSNADRARCVVSSFAADALRMVQELAPDQCVAFLFANEAEEKNAPKLPHYGEHPQHTLLNAKSVARMRERADFVNAWTVNDGPTARKLADLGVDAIISDVPDVVRAALL